LWQLSQALACYNVEVEDDEDDLQNANNLESEGSCEVRRPEIEDHDMMVPLKTKQVNIRTEAEPKYAMLGDYWDDTTVEKVVELLYKYQDLFPKKITELKGILADLGVMKITLNPHVKPVKQ